MRKVRSNALWNELSPEHKEVLDTWLFENKMSYAKIYPKAKRELRFKGSLASLKRYGKRRKQEQLLEKLKDWGHDTAQVGNAGAGPDQLRIANMRVLNGYLFEALRDDPKALKELGPVVRAMLQNDYTEAIRELKNRELQIREEALAFTKEKFQFDVMEKALRALPQLRELAEARKDPKTKQAEQKERFKQLRRMMFGDEDEAEEEEEEEMLQAPNSQASAVAEAMADKPENPQDPNDEESNAQ